MSIRAKFFRPLRKSKSLFSKWIRSSAASPSVSSRPSTTHGPRSLRSTHRARSLKAKSRTRPNSACLLVSTATLTAWFTSQTSTGTVQANRLSKSTTRVKSLRLSFSMLTSRRNASRSASSSFPATRSAKQQLRVNCARTPL